MPAVSSQPTRGDYVSLKEHLETRIESVEKSIDVANAVMQHRLQGMNEFRETLRDQASKFITRTEMDAKQEATEGRLKSLEISKAILEGKASQAQVNLSLLLSLIGLAVAVISLIVNVVP